MNVNPIKEEEEIPEDMKDSPENLEIIDEVQQDLKEEGSFIINQDDISDISESYDEEINPNLFIDFGINYLISLQDKEPFIGIVESLDESLCILTDINDEEKTYTFAIQIINNDDYTDKKLFIKEYKKKDFRYKINDIYIDLCLSSLSFITSLKNSKLINQITMITKK